MTIRRVAVGMLLTVVLLGGQPVLALAGPEIPDSQQEDTNLVRNPGFEGLWCAPSSAPGWCDGNWTHNAFDGSNHGNIFTPQAWVSWWREGGGYGQPEIKTIPRVPPFTGELERIRTGNYAVLLFTFYRLQDMGLYQVVTGLQPGSTVQFSAYAHGWSCNSDDHLGYSCGDPWNQRFQVGIEPNGSTNPFSGNILWSAEQRSPDTYRLIGPVTAQVGSSGKVTVLLRSRTKWAFKYGDAYWDDTRLVVLSGTQPTATPLPTATPFVPTPTPVPPTAVPVQPTAVPVQPTAVPVQPTAVPVQPTAVPAQPTATPAPAPPGGSSVHVVVSGDTLYGIARRYGVNMWDIVHANGIANPNLIHPGQRLTIPGATAPAPPSPPAAGTVHVVQRGETLTRIALRYSVSVWTIVRANSISNPNLIFPGQRLTIPGGG